MMNYNNNYVDNGIHDRRKVNNANAKDNETWSNVGYTKGSIMHLTNRSGVVEGGNYNTNNASGSDSNIGSNAVGMSGSYIGGHGANYGTQPDNSNFMHNYSSNPNDCYNNDVNSAGTSGYVNSHPIFGKKKKEQHVSNFGNNNISSGTNFLGCTERNLMSNHDVSASSRYNVGRNTQGGGHGNVQGSSYGSVQGNIYGSDYGSGYGNALTKESYSARGGVMEVGGHGYSENKGQMRSDGSGVFTKNAYGKTLNEGGYDGNLRNQGLSYRENTFKEENLQFMPNVSYEKDMMSRKVYNPMQPFQGNSGMSGENSFFTPNIGGGKMKQDGGGDPNSAQQSNAQSSGAQPGRGIMQNIFESLTNNVQTSNEINSLMKQRVANIVMTEIEKKMEMNETSFICSKLSLLRDYFNVTHSYVVNKILFILMPYIYIRRAFCESRTYYVYNHLKKKMENTQDKNYSSAFILNGNRIPYDSKNRQGENMNRLNQELNSQNNNNFFFNDKKGNNGNMIRNNSNDINYVDYSSNIGIFKADLYIPLMSTITYILLYTLTLTAQKNNFTFNPDNLFNVSSYVFILLFLETIIIKFFFLLVCRDINLSFLHILSFISYKFVIMCALILTKIGFYFLFFMYTSIFGEVEDTMKKVQSNKKLLMNNSHAFKNLNNTFTFHLSPYNIILFLNSHGMYRLTQLYYYITVSVQMIQIFKSIHLYIHDNSNLLNNFNIKRINVLILIFSFSQIFLCWMLTPYFS
ncbi:C-13 antigen, putative [Plasmodium ovale]|uniref:C-13 antigen, putative n=1 Tax=Plasmodium ovale TaxID=36330 RepID=A0A1D3KY08_PLAOA|nr:C-13 antigen, putative [Plasmodium ovale]